MISTFNIREACAINLGSTVIITGGIVMDNYPNGKLNAVHQYNESGYMGDLPPLLSARSSHACSFFVNDAGIKVEKNSQFSYVNINCCRHIW